MVAVRGRWVRCWVDGHSCSYAAPPYPGTPRCTHPFGASVQHHGGDEQPGEHGLHETAGFLGGPDVLPLVPRFQVDAAIVNLVQQGFQVLACGSSGGGGKARCCVRRQACMSLPCCEWLQADKGCAGAPPQQALWRMQQGGVAGGGDSLTLGLFRNLE